jgi:hypothetical protein
VTIGLLSTLSHASTCVFELLSGESRLPRALSSRRAVPDLTSTHVLPRPASSPRWRPRRSSLGSAGCPTRGVVRGRGRSARGRSPASSVTCPRHPPPPDGTTPWTWRRYGPSPRVMHSFCMQQLVTRAAIDNKTAACVPGERISYQGSLAVSAETGPSKYPVASSPVLTFRTYDASVVPSVTEAGSALWPPALC